MQVGDGAIDHSYWIRPEDMEMPRPPSIVNPSNPGSDVAGETAAALAAASMVFQGVDDAYSTELLTHATDLYKLANNYRGIYSSEYYTSKSYGDELAWAAAWIFYATGDLAWKAEAESMHTTYIDSEGVPWSFSWGTKNAGVNLLMFEITRNSTYAKKLKKFLNGWLPENDFPHTPLGLAFRSDWGPLRFAAATAMLSLFAADSGIRAIRYKDWGKQQIDYMLGDSGRSFVVGFGVNPPQSPHHRASSCTEVKCGSVALNSADVNPNVLQGALVGGPDIQDNYIDNRKDYVKNEVACDYNAAFQSAVAALLHMELPVV
ncbi:endoglucanase F-like [Saccoglossus kowalevskii]